jgi:hypothetical protein
VGLVHRVKTAAHQADAAGTQASVQTHTQALGGKKSVYRRASGVPASGCQS